MKQCNHRKPANGSGSDFKKVVKWDAPREGQLRLNVDALVISKLIYYWYGFERPCWPVSRREEFEVGKNCFGIGG